MTRIYGLILRTSLVVASLAAVASVYDTFERNRLEASEAFSRRYSYQCMSRVPDEELERLAKNDYGNYNARRVACSDKDFFGSSEEILLIRSSGIDKLIPVPSLDFGLMGMNAGAAFIGWGLLSLLLGGLLVLAYRVARWTWSGKWTLTEKSD
jgi:hypothetical protein